MDQGEMDRPITPKEAYDGNHWRKRALLTITKAKATSDHNTQSRLMRVAVEYQKLAQRADRVCEQIDQLEMRDGTSPPFEIRE